MIIVGYPGIGKTSYALEQDNTIDLDSSFLNDDYGAKFEDWEEIYVKMAIELSKQGNDVFISAHKEVRNWLLWYRGNDDSFRVGLVYPSVNLKDEWIEKLKMRVDNTPRALDRVKEFYTEDVRALEMFSVLFDYSYRIDNMDYDLGTVVHNFKKEAYKL